MSALTSMQAKCLSAIAAAISERGTAPSVAELAASLGLKSKSGVCRLLNGLEERGAIRRIPFRTRSIEVTTAGTATDVLAFLDDHTRALITRRAARRGLRPQTIVAEICRQHFAN